MRKRRTVFDLRFELGGEMSTSAERRSHPPRLRRRSRTTRRPRRSAA